jgi:hypothetical protein
MALCQPGISRPPCSARRSPLRTFARAGCCLGGPARRATRAWRHGPRVTASRADAAATHGAVQPASCAARPQTQLRPGHCLDPGGSGGGAGPWRCRRARRRRRGAGAGQCCCAGCGAALGSASPRRLPSSRPCRGSFRTGSSCTSSSCTSSSCTSSSCTSSSCTSGCAGGSRGARPGWPAAGLHYRAQARPAEAHAPGPSPPGHRRGRDISPVRPAHAWRGCRERGQAAAGSGYCCCCGGCCCGGGGPRWAAAARRGLPQPAADAPRPHLLLRHLWPAAFAARSP